MTVIDESKLPDFDELPGSEGFPKDTSTGGLFGDSYELGTLNFLTPERVAEAAKLAKTGRRFNLSPAAEPALAYAVERDHRSGRAGCRSPRRARSRRAASRTPTTCS